MYRLRSQRRVLTITAFSVFLGFAIMPILAHAQADSGGFTALAPTPPSSKLGVLYGGQGDLSTFINGLFKFALAIGAILAVLRLSYAGFLYMGQSDMWSHKGQAKTIMGDVVLGLLLLLGTWIILNQINPDILTLSALKAIQSNPAPQAQQTSLTPAQQAAQQAEQVQTNSFVQDLQQTGFPTN